MAHAGTHTLGPADGAIEVRTYREGLAQKVGHDLIIDVTQWQATIDVAQDGNPSAVTLDVDSRSLRVREGRNGLKPLNDSDRADILKSIDEKILHGQPIVFRSSAVEGGAARLTVRGDLTIDATTRPATFQLVLTAAGRLSATLALTQSEWGIKPYRGLLGALKVRDTVEIVLDVALPSD